MRPRTRRRQTATECTTPLWCGAVSVRGDLPEAALPCSSSRKRASHYQGTGASFLALQKNAPHLAGRWRSPWSCNGTAVVQLRNSPCAASTGARPMSATSEPYPPALQRDTRAQGENESNRTARTGRRKCSSLEAMGNPSRPWEIPRGNGKSLEAMGNPSRLWEIPRFAALARDLRSLGIGARSGSALGMTAGSLRSLDMTGHRLYATHSISTLQSTTMLDTTAARAGG